MDSETREAGLTPEIMAALRAPFDPSQIGKKPQPFKKDSAKGKCKPKREGGDAPDFQDYFCGGWHELPALHLDFVGHAAVTDRLLAVDPHWNWSPMAVDTDGFPKLVNNGLGMWIWLTVCGVSRIGFGSVAERQSEREKELIGDAIRNAALRFGVALDLWIKGQQVEEQAQNVPTDGTVTAEQMNRIPDGIRAAHSPKPPAGWDSWEECNREHDDLKATIQALPEEAQEAMRLFRREQGYPWPMSATDAGHMWQQLGILAGDKPIEEKTEEEVANDLVKSFPGSTLLGEGEK